MVDSQARMDLAASLLKLVKGEMTNDDFDIAYYKRWMRSPDAGVREVAQFGYGLYSSDLLVPYKLKGFDAVSEEEQRIASNALRFLSTHQEYDWPTEIYSIVPFWCMWGPGFYLGAGFLWFFLAVWGKPESRILFVVVGLLAICYPIHWLVTYSHRKSRWNYFLSNGQIEAWPFRSTSDLEKVASAESIAVE